MVQTHLPSFVLRGTGLFTKETFSNFCVCFLRNVNCYVYVCGARNSSVFCINPQCGSCLLTLYPWTQHLRLQQQLCVRSAKVLCWVSERGTCTFQLKDKEKKKKSSTRKHDCVSQVALCTSVEKEVSTSIIRIYLCVSCRRIKFVGQSSTVGVFPHNIDRKN